MKYKSISHSSLLGLSLLFAVTGAHAQSASRANVPFDFKVGTKQMPAGTYTVENQVGTDILLVRNVQTGISALALGRRESAAKKANKLIFRRYGSQYFLTTILGSKGSQGFVIPASRQEKELEVAQASAVNANNVEIASR